MTEKYIVSRTQEEIVARFMAADDAFGWAREVLVQFLGYEHVRPLLNEDIGEAEWEKLTAVATNDIGQEAREYYALALDKIENERGISAERSVVKLTEFAWLMGADDVLAAMEEAEYTPYGAPKVAVFGAAFGLEGN